MTLQLTARQREMLETASRDEEGVFRLRGAGFTRTGNRLVRLGLMRENGCYGFRLTWEGRGVLLDLALERR